LLAQNVEEKEVVVEELEALGLRVHPLEVLPLAE
jgi:hypothetical protein